MSLTNFPPTLSTLPPELLEIILTHLCQSDLTQCVRVCRSWKEALTPYLWQTLAIYSQSQLDRFLSSESQKALQKNLLFVRELHLAHDEMYEKLLSPHVARSWRSIFGLRSSKEPDTHRPLFAHLDALELHPPQHPTHVSSGKIVTLIQQNHGIRRLRINVDLPHLALPSHISDHLPYLQELHLASSWRGDVKALLEMLPECIRAVWLRDIHHITFNGADTSFNETSGDTDVSVVRQHPMLESFVIEGSLEGLEGLVLPPFLESCSQRLLFVGGLESTFYRHPRVVEALLKIGYRWKVLQRQPWQHFLPDAQLAQIIRRSAYWTNIDLHTCVVGPLTAAAIADNGANLEILEIIGSGAKGLTGAHLQTVLSEAPRLRSLQAHWLVERDVIHAADILSSDWATTVLEHIDFKIDVPRATDNDAPDSMAVQSSRTLQRLVLQRLGQQRNLRRIVIGGMVVSQQIGFHHQRNCCEMTLESGLDELAGLQNLEYLDIHHMDHRLGLPELRWMQKNLPNLQHVRGMRDSLRPPLLEVERWIQTNQPGWWI